MRRRVEKRSLARAGLVPTLLATSVLAALLWAGGLFAQVEGLNADDYASASDLATEVLLLDADSANGYNPVAALRVQARGFSVENSVGEFV